jgi:hypothetical protein
MNLGTPEQHRPLFEELALLLPAIAFPDPTGVIRQEDRAAQLLEHPALVVERSLEMLNVFLVRGLRGRKV